MIGTFISFTILTLFLIEPGSCIKVLSHDGACKVTTDKGDIDITSLGNTDGTARFKGVKDTTNYFMMYDFNPCKDFSEPGGGGLGSGCQNVAVCEISTKFGYQYNSLGPTSSAKFGVSDDGNVTISYSDSTNGFSQTIKLLCTDDGEDDLVVEHGQSVSLVLRSEHCCAAAPPTPSPHASGLSVGSILCITLLVLVCLYIAGGLVFTMGYKKSQGKERIPNVELWTSIPGLVKDGVKFSVCCGGRSGSAGGAKYDQI